MLRIYVSYFFLCIKFLFKLHKYKAFLKRKIGKPAVRRFRILRTHFEGKAQVEAKRKRYSLTRTEFFVYISTFLAEESDPRRLKEELEAPLAMLLLWMCEPIKEKPPEEE